MKSKVILQNQKLKNVRGHPVQLIGNTPSFQFHVTDKKTITLDNYRFWLRFISIHYWKQSIILVCVCIFD